MKHWYKYFKGLEVDVTNILRMEFLGSVSIEESINTIISICKKDNIEVSLEEKEDLINYFEIHHFDRLWDKESILDQIKVKAASGFKDSIEILSVLGEYTGTAVLTGRRCSGKYSA